MKLRNKKTDEILTNNYPSYDRLKDIIEEIHKLAEESILYLPIIKSLDYEEEKEPLIKDEKLRKAVKYYFLCVGGFDKIKVSFPEGAITLFENEYGSSQLYFPYVVDMENYEAGTYTIAELCGEEE